MYKFNLCLSLFNKFVALLISVSLLSTVVLFNVENNIKNKVDTLCKATSISDYYNTIANFSYSIINTIVESTNLFVKDNKAKDTNKENSKSNKDDSKDFTFIQLNNEKASQNLKLTSSNFSNILITINSFKCYLVQKYMTYTCGLIFAIVSLNFCYFARGNIEEKSIKFNNIVKEIRLA